MGVWEDVLDVTVRIVLALALLIVGLWVIGKVRKNLERLVKLNTSFPPALATWVASLTSFLLKYFLMTMVFGVLGLSTSLFAVFLTAFVLALALSLEDSIANMAAGLMLLMFEYYKVGDIVEIGGELGTVNFVHLYTTELLTPDGSIIFITNLSALEGNIVNLTCQGTRTLRLNVAFGIGYGDDLHKARQIVLDVLRKDPLVLDEPKPEVVVVELGDNSVNMLARPWIHPWGVGSDGRARARLPPGHKFARDTLVNAASIWTAGLRLTEVIKEALDEGGISIPFPQEDWHLNLVEGLKSPVEYPSWKRFGDRPGGADAFFRRPTHPDAAADKAAQKDKAQKKKKKKRGSFGSMLGRASRSASSAFSGGARSAKGLFSRSSSRDSAASAAEPAGRGPPSSSATELGDAGSSSDLRQRSAPSSSSASRSS